MIGRRFARLRWFDKQTGDTKPDHLPPADHDGTAISWAEEVMRADMVEVPTLGEIAASLAVVALMLVLLALCYGAGWIQ